MSYIKPKISVDWILSTCKDTVSKHVYHSYKGISIYRNDQN